MSDPSNDVDLLFEECVEKKYRDAYKNGCIHEFTQTSPYNFAFLEDFWAPSFYREISNIKPVLAKGFDSNPNQPEARIYFEPYDYLPFIQLVYRRSFMDFLACLVGKSRSRRPQNAYPQLRTIKSGGPGLAIHSDVDAPYNGVAFFNINDGWKKGDGGELVIWEGLGDQKFKKRFEFPPVGNSLSIMHFSPYSFHSVNRALGEWTRNNILLELDFT